MAGDPGTLAFVQDVVRWSTGVAVGVTALGALLTRDFRFPLAFAVGAAVDIATIRLLLRDVSPVEGFAGAGRTATLLVAGRLVLKAVLLAAAAMLPRYLDLWGMAAGVLVFDVTVMTAGSFSAAMNVRNWRV